MIPDGEMNYVSYELLLEEVPASPDGDFRNVAYLLRKYTMQYQYSAALYVKSLSVSKLIKPTAGFWGMAPDFSQIDQGQLRANLGARDDTSSVFSNLPGAIEEVLNLSKIMGGQTATGLQATEAAFKKNSSQYGILHLATHSVVNNANPLRSKLVLTPGDGEDGMLNTYELFDLELNAGLVTLSACNSGIGTIEEGEGVVSLARGFTYAGCPSVLMSLWPVPDATTGELMASFYSYLQAGRSKSDALRQAKLDYLDKSNRLSASPFYWGGFVTLGYDPADLQRLGLRVASAPVGNPWLYIGIAAGLALAVIGAVVYTSLRD
jgi:CHAT domain-containing protein